MSGPSPDTEPYSGTYWDHVFEHWEPTPVHRLWRAHSDAVNVRLLRRWLGRSVGPLLKTDLFDEAVGRGLYPELAASAPEVIGVDVSAAVIHAASRRYPALETRLADVRALPFDEATFDVIVSNSTLDHFDSHAKLSAAVRELARILRPGGRLMITLDNRMNPIVALRTSRLFGTLYRLRIVPYYVGATHGPRGLATALAANGFEIGEMTSIMQCPPQLAAALAARRMRGLDPAPEPERDHVRRVLRCETMEHWPTRYLTGHFVAALAVRR